MRGNAALVPIGFAVFFGVMNGITSPRAHPLPSLLLIYPLTAAHRIRHIPTSRCRRPSQDPPREVCIMLHWPRGYRLLGLVNRGVKEAVSSDALSEKKSEAVQAANVNEREAKKDLLKPKGDTKSAP